MSPLNSWIPWILCTACKKTRDQCACHATVASCGVGASLLLRSDVLRAFFQQDQLTDCCRETRYVFSAPLRSIAGAVLSHDWPCLWISRCWMLDASFPQHCCSFPFWPRAWSKVQRCLIDSSRPWIRPSYRRVPSAEEPAAIQCCRAARPQPDPGPEPSLKSQGKSTAVTTFSQVGGGKQRERMESKMLVFKYSRKLWVWR